MCGVLDREQTSHTYLKCLTMQIIMRSWLYPFFHIALLNDFGSFVLCMSNRLFDSAHSSTASPSLSVEVYSQSVLWLLKSPVTI